MRQSMTARLRRRDRGSREDPLSREQLLISKFLRELSLTHRLWGVDERQVWQAMEQLVELYEDALTLERSRRELAQRKLEALRCAEEVPDGT